MRTPVVLFVIGLIGCDARSISPKPAPDPTTAAKGVDTTPAAVTIRPVKLAEFEKAIAEQKGKIVVIDFWADFCAPCKANFHHLVEMQEKYGKDGVVCFSAAVDEIDQKDACLKFLERKKAHRIQNFLIDEKAGVWQDRWDFTAIPAVVVYGRDGTMARKFTWDDPDNQFTYPQVETFVADLAKKK